MIKIKFFGAAGTVTGSKYLVEYHDEQGATRRLVVDCGLFQGERTWREKNWDGPDAATLKSVECCLITHAHVDHSGILPRWMSKGMSCPVYATAPTCDLMQFLLKDSAMIQEEDAEFRTKRGRSSHNPPLPLYTLKQAEDALGHLMPVPFNEKVEVAKGVWAKWRHAGHILGAANITLYIGDESVVFSGDVGRYGVPILRDPEPVEFGDLLLIESTYGDSLHGAESPMKELGRVVRRALENGGALVIPSFAVGRTQLILYYLRELKERREIPDLPVIIDSPMASDVTGLYAKYPSDYDEEALGLLKTGRSPFVAGKMHFTKDRQESIALNSIRDPMILISASGMLTGGRILHHLRHRLSDPATTVLFVGYQPPGSRGGLLKAGAKSISIFNEQVQVNAEIAELSACSAHADKNELLRWCREGTGKPKKTVVVHGEPETAVRFRDSMVQELGWNVEIARYLGDVTVGS